MSTLVPPGAEPFKNGQPAFDHDQCFSCFEDRGILFRLVNTEKKRWAFYNDTTDLHIRVRAQFGAGSVIKALQRAHMRNLVAAPAAPAVPDATQPSDADPGAQGSSAEAEKSVHAADIFGPLQSEAAGKYAFEVTLEIEPGFTELFIEGTVNGFTMDFTTESAPVKNVQFTSVGPSCEYTKMYKCFKDQGNGLLFRLVNERERFWAFYNDTKEYVMKVSVEFDDESEVTPLGTTHVTPKASSNADSHSPVAAVFVLYIQPGKTEMFVQGIPTLYKLNFAAEPVEPPNAPKDSDAPVYRNGHPDPAIIPNLSHVYQCFKGHDNGLLFRCVDDVHKIWAFYNDTNDYIMNVNVRFPPRKPHLAAADGSSALDDFVFAPNVHVMEDTEVAGGFIGAAQVPPLATIPFLAGELHDITYELAFSAEPSTKSVAEAAPVYECAGPDLTKIPGGRVDEVFKCFKEHGNGLLFRLVKHPDEKEDIEAKKGFWAFYNDTRDVVMHVKVSFGENARVKPLGQTKIDADDDMGVVYICEVLPQTTEPFADGEVGSFTTKFTATKMK